MAVPGLNRVGGSDYVLALTSSKNNVQIGYVTGDVGAFGGAPIGLTIYVAAGVTIGSTSTGSPAILIGAPLNANSRILIVNEGTIVGCGGDGGKGRIGTAPPPSSGHIIAGSGGGGAGRVVGLGAESYAGVEPTTIGEDGQDEEFGGAGGVGTSVSFPTVPPLVTATAGTDGGDAIQWGDHYVTIMNASGNIWGGGGGGGGGGAAPVVGLIDGGNGGGAGEDGDSGEEPSAPSAPSQPGGSAGYAYTATRAPTFLGGASFPNLRGQVSP